MKFGFDWPRGFSFENGDDDGCTPELGYTIRSPCELKKHCLRGFHLGQPSQQQTS